MVVLFAIGSRYTSCIRSYVLMVPQFIYYSGHFSMSVLLCHVTTVPTLSKRKFHESLYYWKQTINMTQFHPENSRKEYGKELNSFTKNQVDQLNVLNDFIFR